jgi:hypothetical protein
MSLGDSLFSLVSSATRRVARTVEAVAVPGVVKDAVRGAAKAVTSNDTADATETRASAWSVPATDPVPRPEPAPLRDPVAHEPTASSRAEAHGGPAGRHGDDWRDELVEDDEPLPEPEPSDEPLISPGAARALRKETDVLRRGAQPNS